MNTLLHHFRWRPAVLVAYHMVDTGVGGGVGDRLKGGSGPVGVSGRRHLPGEVNLCLIDARLLAALLHHRVLGVVWITGGHAHKGVTGRGHLLAALLRHLLDVIVVGQGDHLRRKEDGLFYYPGKSTFCYYLFQQG